MRKLLNVSLILIIMCLANPGAILAQTPTTHGQDAAMPTGDAKWVDGTPIMERVRGPVQQEVVSKSELMALGRMDAAGSVLAFKVGDTHDFITYNFLTEKEETTSATLKRVGTHSYAWVANDQTVNASTVESIGNEFDTKIYLTDTSYFGTEPNIDGDPLIHILIFDIKDDYGTGTPPVTSYTGGYFDKGDQGGGNRMDMFYMDSNPGSPGSNTFYGTLAHEFQHMIHYNMDGGHDEELWLNEGLADYAVVACGYGIPYDHVNAFAAAPDTQLTDEFNSDLEEYGASFLFVEYLAELVERAGKTVSDFTKQLVDEEADGTAAIDAVLPTYLGNDRDTFEEVFPFWVTANYIDAPSGDYGYQKLNVHVTPQSTLTYAGSTVNSTGQVRPTTARYIKLSIDNNHTNLNVRVEASTVYGYAVKVLQLNNGDFVREWLPNFKMEYLPPKRVAELEVVGIDAAQGEELAVVFIRSGTLNLPTSGDYTAKIDATTIGKGLNYLHQQRAANGSWSNNVGITGLATLAFLNHGYTESDSDVSPAIQYILANRQADGSISNDSGHATYHTGIAMLPLKATHKADYADEIQSANDWLVASQWDTGEGISESNSQWGGFGYGRNVRPDLSNTQFALLGLDAADLPDTDATWGKTIKFASRCQNRTASNEGYSSNNDGGFNYVPGSSVAGGTVSIGSTTGAGIWSLALAGLTPSDPLFADALKWVESHYSWDYNPATNGNWGDNGLYYYYLSMSKALSMARKTTIGGVLGIGAHDWYKELSDKLGSLQRSDGSWVNSNGWASENNADLVTAYALLALQTRKLPQNADLEMVIILHSPADLHLYDAEGRHVGKNYQAGTIDLEIPGSGYDPGDPQRITVNPPVAGNYHLEMIGTADGNWRAEIAGTQDGIQVSYDSYTGTVTSGEVVATDLNVGAFEGALTIFSNQPELAAVMATDPPAFKFAENQGGALQASFMVSETQAHQAIQGVSIFSSDLVGPNESIIPSGSIQITPTVFEVPAGGGQAVTVTIPLAAGLPDGVYTGTVTVESLNAGSKGVQLGIQVGGPHGYVWVDRNGNDRRDPDEGLSEVVLILSDALRAPTPTATWAAVTDRDGRYRFSVIPEGQYTAVLNDPQKRVVSVSRKVNVAWGVMEMSPFVFRQIYLPLISKK